MKEYVIHAKVRNNLIYERIMEFAPNVAQFCVQHSLNQGLVGCFINMREAPLNKAGAWRPEAIRLAAALQCDVSDLFTAEQQKTELVSNKVAVQLSTQEMLEMRDASELLSIKQAATFLLDKAELTPRQKDILARRIEGDTLAEIGATYGVSKECVRATEAKALRKLRRAAVKNNLTPSDIYD